MTVEMEYHQTEPGLQADHNSSGLLQQERRRPFIMHGMRCRPKLIMVTAVLFSCSRPSVIPTPEPVPTFPPTQPQPSPSRTTKSEWHLSPDPSAHSYKSTTKSTIRSTDQPAGREISTQSETWFTISTNSLRKPVLVSGSVDS